MTAARSVSRFWQRRPRYRRAWPSLTLLVVSCRTRAGTVRMATGLKCAFYEELYIYMQEWPRQTAAAGTVSLNILLPFWDVQAQPKQDHPRACRTAQTLPPNVSRRRKVPLKLSLSSLSLSSLQPPPPPSLPLIEPTYKPYSCMESMDWNII